MTRADDDTRERAVAVAVRLDSVLRRRCRAAVAQRLVRARTATGEDVDGTDAFRFEGRRVSIVHGVRDVEALPRVTMCETAL